MEQLALTISEACATARIGRTSLYAAIKRGELVATKYRRKTLIRTADLRTWLDSLPTIRGGSANDSNKVLSSR